MNIQIFEYLFSSLPQSPYPPSNPTNPQSRNSIILQPLNTHSPNPIPLTPHCHFNPLYPCHQKRKSTNPGISCMLPLASRNNNSYLHTVQCVPICSTIQLVNVECPGFLSSVSNLLMISGLGQQQERGTG